MGYLLATCLPILGVVQVLLSRSVLGVLNTFPEYLVKQGSPFYLSVGYSHKLILISFLYALPSHLQTPVDTSHFSE